MIKVKVQCQECEEVLELKDVLVLGHGEKGVLYASHDLDGEGALDLLRFFVDNELQRILAGADPSLTAKALLLGVLDAIRDFMKGEREWPSRKRLHPLG